MSAVSCDFGLQEGPSPSYPEARGVAWGTPRSGWVGSEGKLGPEGRQGSPRMPPPGSIHGQRILGAAFQAVITYDKLLVDLERD